ncbi:ABC transporter ATP-binding protein [Thermodesulfobacteriota bacterium]
MLFEIKNLTKLYGDRSVLEISSLVFEKKAIYALLGPNGSGKTTLLEILSLLDPPTTGYIKYDGRVIDFRANDLTRLRKEIVMVQQSPVLFTTTVFKNLEFGLKIRGISKIERDKIIDASLDLVGMREFVNAPAHKLSGGETQRIAIAQALACSPKVMFFDEPTANVDMESQIAVERIMLEINSEKKISVIFTTHNLTQASRLSHRWISLFEGKISRTVFENIFGGNVVQDEEGRKICLIQNRVRIPVDTDKSGKVRLSIDPFQIKLQRMPATHYHGVGLKGILVQLTDEKHHVRIVCDIGIPLNILLPKEELSEKILHVGEEVDVLFSTEAIRIL